MSDAEPITLSPEDSQPASPSNERGSDATFDKLGLSADTLRGVSAAGYEAATPIQAQAIPVLLSGADMIGQAQTGTGKTAAFALPLIDSLDPREAYPQGLILCPTRELAVQVSESIYTLGRPKGFRILPVYGGQPIDRQLRALKGGPQIVVGTPGRLLDHLRRGTLDLSRVKTVVLDEADEMLDMGFIEDIEVVLDALPEERQIALFSATMPAPIARLAQKYLRNPQRVVIQAAAHTIPQIRQSYYEVVPSRKIDALTRILDMETPGPTIVFCRTKRDADEVGEHLRGRGYGAESLHGDLSQAERDRVMRRFRAGQTDLLIATDVAARGLDIETVTHVINYDIPWDAEVYTHRIGRTGRAGREGDAITLVGPRDRRLIKSIERAIGQRIMPVRLPTLGDIAVRKREVFRQSIRDGLAEGGFEDFLVTVEELSEEFEASDIAAAALKLLWLQQGNQVSAQEMRPTDGVRAEDGMTRLFITVGRDHGLRPTDLVGAIANEAGIPGNAIGAIDIMDGCSFVEVPQEAADRVVKALARTTLRGRKVRVEKAPAGFEEVPQRDDDGPRGGGNYRPRNDGYGNRNEGYGNRGGGYGNRQNEGRPEPRRDYREDRNDRPRQDAPRFEDRNDNRQDAPREEARNAGGNGDEQEVFQGNYRPRDRREGPAGPRPGGRPGGFGGGFGPKRPGGPARPGKPRFGGGGGGFGPKKGR